jgi:hypothetical protein
LPVAGWFVEPAIGFSADGVRLGFSMCVDEESGHGEAGINGEFGVARGGAGRLERFPGRGQS